MFFLVFFCLFIGRMPACERLCREFALGLYLFLSGDCRVRIVAKRQDARILVMCNIIFIASERNLGSLLYVQKQRRRVVEKGKCRREVGEIKFFTEKRAYQGVQEEGVFGEGGESVDGGCLCDGGGLVLVEDELVIFQINLIKKLE